MKQRIEEIEKLTKSKLLEEIDNLNGFGTLSKDKNLSQRVLKMEASLDEICHIYPSNPLFKPGVLLTSPDIFENDDDCYGMTKSLSCGDDEDSGIYIRIGETKEIEHLGTTKRVLVPETIMVTGESIQIKKHQSVRTTDSISKTINKQFCEYHVCHFLHVIDDKRKMFIPTKLFKERDSHGRVSRHSNDLIMEDYLDFETIAHVYKSADAEEIIKPLVFLQNK